MNEFGRLIGVVLIIAAALILTGCQTELYHGLSEQSANEMVVALEQHGIEAAKTPDARSAEHWMVTVPSAVKVEALRVLQSRGLPRPEIRGFGEFFPSEGLIPTASEERVLLQYATSQELRRSLLTIDGVVDAHVNLVLPEKPRVRLANASVSPPRASVLVKYRIGDGNEAPVSEAQVKTLVAGGVESLEPEAVRVVMTPVTYSELPLTEPKLVQVGPVSVAPTHKTTLQMLMAGLLGFIVLLSATVGVLLIRRRT